MLSTGRGGTSYSNEMVMLSARNNQETCPEVAMDYVNTIPTVNSRMKPESRKEMDQPHMKTSGGHGRREGKGQVTDANAIPITSTVDLKTQRNPMEQRAADVYELITPTDEVERADKHTYQPLIPPKPMKPGVLDSGGTSSHYEDLR